MQTSKTAAQAAATATLISSQPVNGDFNARVIATVAAQQAGAKQTPKAGAR